MIGTRAFLKKKAIEAYVEVGFRQKQLPLLTQGSFLFQFAVVYLMKASILDQAFNPTVHRAATFVVDNLVRDAVVFAVSSLLIIFVLMFGAWCFLQRSEKSRRRLSKTLLSAENMRRTIVVTGLFLASFLMLCLALSIRWLSTVFSSPEGRASVGVLVFVTATALLAAVAALLLAREMLLGKGTLLILLSCPGVGWNFPVVKAAALVLLLGFLWTRGGRPSLLFRVLRTLLSFLFLLDALMPGISTLFFVMLNLALAALVATTPEPEFERDSLEINELILQSLEKMKKEGRLKRREEFRLLPTLFAVQEQYEGTKGMKLGNPLSYERLRDFFRAKVAQDVEQNKQESGFRLQGLLFRLRHSDLTLNLLHEVSAFPRELGDGLSLEARVRLLEMSREVEERFVKREQQLNLGQVVEVCARIEGANARLEESLSRLEKFWAEVEGQEMSERELVGALGEVAEREGAIEETVLQIRGHASTSAQARLYCYGLRLLNFDYEAGQAAPQGEIKLASTYFLVAREGRVSEVSSQLLLELRRKKQEVEGERLEALVPRELVPFVEQSFSSVFDHSRAEKVVLPFLDLAQQLVPFRVQFEVRFHPQAGVQNVLHFFRSEDLREQPVFLYCADSDRILHLCPLFEAFLRTHDRRLEGQLLGIDLFGVELSHVIGSGERRAGDTVASALVRQKGRQASLPLTLRVREIFRSGDACLALLAVESGQGLNEAELDSKVFSLGNFVERREAAECSEERARLAKEARGREGATFCRIANPYETIIDEKMSKIKVLFRWSYLKVTLILMVALLLLFVVFMAYLTVYADRVDTQNKRVVNYASQKLFEVQTIYFLYYQFYQYQLIKHHPEYPLSIQPYNISALQNSYRTKASNNIVKLINSRIKGLIQENKQYTLEFESYNVTKTTSVISMIDFMTDIKQAIESGNSTFATMNEPHIQTIVSAYKPISTVELQNIIQIMKIGGACILAAMLVLALIIKGISFQLKYISRDILSLYEHIPSSVIKKQVKKYRELRGVTQYTGESLKKDEQSQEDQSKPLENESRKDEGVRIKKQSLLELIFTNNLVIFFCAMLFALFFWEKIILDNYQSNTELVINKLIFLVDSRVAVLKPAEKFFQAAMEERILPSQRRPQPPAGVIDVKVSNIHYKLPSYFDSYQEQERQALSSDLCTKINNGLLYNGVNCSGVLNGVMNKNYAETFMIFLSLVRNFSGVGLSKLGGTFRQGATYPVWMEVCYTRDTLSNLFNSLEASFVSRLDGYMKIQKESITNLLWNALYIVPILVVLLVLELKRINEECKAVIKSFKILPKSYLLKMKTSKFLRQEQILDKVQAISF